jgi:hypothetical protein
MKIMKIIYRGFLAPKIMKNRIKFIVSLAQSFAIGCYLGSSFTEAKFQRECRKKTFVHQASDGKVHLYSFADVLHLYNTNIVALAPTSGIASIHSPIRQFK